MNIGIVGLGLIGGSFAKALKARTNNNIFGFDISPEVMLKACTEGIIEKPLYKEELSNCDLVIISLYPADTVDYIKNNAAYFKKNSVVMDCCGVKELICKEASIIAAERGFTFVGGHPMAGVEFSGYNYSDPNLFDNASMLLIPTDESDLHSLDNLLRQIGFSKIVITNSETHDKRIAFTSQLAHIVSSAYIKSPEALSQSGFSAGSYKDMTRVAFLNEDMWTELFFANSENLLNEIETLIYNLKEYSKALEENNRQLMKKLLAEGKAAKKAADSLN